MHQQLRGYKVEWKSVSRGTWGKKVEYHCSTGKKKSGPLYEKLEREVIMACF
jgi:hypothetical protein